MEKLKFSRNRDSTRKNYHGIWKSFNKFYLNLDIKPNNWEERLILFIGYLVDSQHKTATVKSYISAIKSVLREDGVKLVEDSYLLNSLTRACTYVNDQFTLQLLIQRGLLKVLLDKTEEYYLITKNQPYLATLYKALFSTTYFGLFRVGELTTGSHPVLAIDIHIGVNKNKILFVLRTSKTHWKNSKPQLVKIQSISSNPSKLKKFCPFELLRSYLVVRRKLKLESELFFIFKDGSPVTPNNMRTVLKTILQLGRFDSRLYLTHGFRSGRALDLLKAGLSVETIKKLRRWKSNAVYNYLK